MKKTIFIIIGLLLGLGITVYGAPVYNNVRNLLPETDSIYDIGTSTSRFSNVFTNNLDFIGEIKPGGNTCANGQILKKTTDNQWDCASDDGLTSISSVGSGNSLVYDSAGEIKSLVAGSNVTITDNGNNLEITSTGGSGGTTDHSALTNLNWSSSGHTLDTNLNLGAYYMTFSDITTPATPPQGSVYLYAKTTNGTSTLYYIDASSTEHIWGTGEGGGGGASALIGLTDVDPALTYTAYNVFYADGSKYTGGQFSHDWLTATGTNSHTDIDSHIANTSNPHSVTATQVGAVDLTSDQTIAGLKTFSQFPEVALTPTSTNQLVPKGYADALASGFLYHESVDYASTVNISSLSGYVTVDGFLTVAGDRVLVKNQLLGQNNGCYVVAAGAWSRCTDYDEDSEVIQGSTFLVLNGSDNGNESWALYTDGAIVGTTALTFIQVSPQLTYTAGNGLNLSSSQFKLGGALTEVTTISAPSTYDMIFNLTGTADLRVQDNGTDRFYVDDGGYTTIGSSPLATYYGQLSVKTAADANRGIVVRPYSSTQSANLQEWQSSTGAANAYINAGGNIYEAKTIDSATERGVSSVQTPSTLKSDSASGVDEDFDTQYEAFQFTLTTTSYIRQLAMRLKASATLSNPTATIRAYLYSDSGGVPTTLLATGSLTRFGALTTSYAAMYWNLSYDAPAGTYWIVLMYSTAPTGGTISIQRDNDGTNTWAYGSPSSWSYKNGTPYYILYGRNGYAGYFSANTGYGVYGSSLSGYGGYFSSNNGNAIYGTSPYGYGVYGVSTYSYGGYFNSTYGSAIYGSTNSGYGVYGNSVSGSSVVGVTTSGYGGYFTTISGTALFASTDSGSGIYVQTNNSTANGLQELIRLRRMTSGTAASGIGAYIDWELEDTAGAGDVASRWVTYYVDPTNASEDTAMYFQNRIAGTLGEVLRIDENGTLKVWDGTATVSYVNGKGDLFVEDTLKASSVYASSTLFTETTSTYTYLGSKVGLNSSYITDWSDLYPYGFSSTSADYWLTTKSTTNLTDGTNLYYTDARVNAYIHSSSTIPKLYINNIWTGNNTFSNATSTNFYTNTFGINSEYFTDLTGLGLTNYNNTLRVATSTLGLLTTDVAEGTNLYYTDARVNAYIHASTTIPKLYTSNIWTNNNTFSNVTSTSLYVNTLGTNSEYFNDLTGLGLTNYNNTLRVSTSTLGLLTTDVSEGTNLYYTDSRVNSYIHSSSTIPKTYTENTWSAKNTFTYVSSTAISGTTVCIGTTCQTSWPTGGSSYGSDGDIQISDGDGGFKNASIFSDGQGVFTYNGTLTVTGDSLQVGAIISGGDGMESAGGDALRATGGKGNGAGNAGGGITLTGGEGGDSENDYPGSGGAINITGGNSGTDSYLNFSSTGGNVVINGGEGTAGGADGSIQLGPTRGNVLIGTNSGSYKLTVSGSTKLGGAIYTSGDSAGSWGSLLMSTATGWEWRTTSTLGISGGSGTVNNGSQYQIAYYAANGTTISGNSSFTANGGYVTTTGSVFATGSNGGIGICASPGCLTGYGSTGYPTIKSTGTNMYFDINNTYAGYANNMNFYWGRFVDKDNAAYYIDPATTTTYSLLTAGNVGIGTTTPNATLNINGNLSVGSLSIPTNADLSVVTSTSVVTSYGVYSSTTKNYTGETNTDTYGIYSKVLKTGNSDNTDYAYGVYGEAKVTNVLGGHLAYGVYGKIDPADGNGYGVYGANRTSYGYLGGNSYGVYGYGTTYGVYSAAPMYASATTTLATDLRVDTNTLVVDSFNNRIGIGTTTPWSTSKVNVFDRPGATNSYSTIFSQMEWNNNNSKSSVSQYAINGSAYLKGGTLSGGLTDLNGMYASSEFDGGTIQSGATVILRGGSFTSIGSLGTTGTTYHYGFTGGASGTADYNVGILGQAYGATANVGIIAANTATNYYPTSGDWAAWLIGNVSSSGQLYLPNITNDDGLDTNHVVWWDSTTGQLKQGVGPWYYICPSVYVDGKRQGQILEALFDKEVEDEDRLLIKAHSSKITIKEEVDEIAYFKSIQLKVNDILYDLPENVVSQFGTTTDGYLTMKKGDEITIDFGVDIAENDEVYLVATGYYEISDTATGLYKLIKLMQDKQIKVIQKKISDLEASNLAILARLDALEAQIGTSTPLGSISVNKADNWLVRIINYFKYLWNREKKSLS